MNTQSKPARRLFALLTVAAVAAFAQVGKRLGVVKS